MNFLFVVSFKPTFKNTKLYLNYFYCKYLGVLKHLNTRIAYIYIHLF